MEHGRSREEFLRILLLVFFRPRTCIPVNQLVKGGLSVGYRSCVTGRQAQPGPVLANGSVQPTAFPSAQRWATNSARSVAVTVKICVVFSALLNSMLDGNEQSLYKYNELKFSAQNQNLLVVSFGLTDVNE